MTLIEKIDVLKNELQLNKRQLSIESGIPYTTIDSFYKKGVDNMKLSTFKTLCDFFNVDMESMAYDDQEIRFRDDKPIDFLSQEEKELIDMYSAVSFDKQQMVYQSLKTGYDTETTKKDGASALSDAG